MHKHRSVILPVAACLTVQLCVGILYLWSVFNASVTRAFELTPSEGTMVSSYMLFAFVFGCLIGGHFNDKKGPRFTVIIGILLFGFGIGLSGLLTAKTAMLINFTYALMGGLGAGFCYTACMSCIQKWFPDKRGFASGLAAAAFGFSTVIFAPVSRALMNAFTNPDTGIVNFTPVFLILGTVFLVVGLISSLFIRLPSPDSPQAITAAQIAVGKKRSVFSEQLHVDQIVKTQPFWYIFFTIFFSAATWTLTVPLISDLGVQRGLTLTEATLLISLTGIVNAVGRLVLSSLSDKVGRSTTIVILSCITIVGALMLTFVTGAGYWAAILFIAFAYGGPGPLAAAFAVDFFGAKNSARNFGLITLSLGCSSVVCNFISNHILHGHATPTFFMAALFATIPIGLMVLLHGYEKKIKTKVVLSKKQPKPSPM